MAVGYLNPLKNFSMICLPITILSLVVFVIIDFSWTEPEEWKANIAAKCVFTNSIPLSFCYEELAVSCYSSYTIGSYFGLIVDAKYFKGTHRRIHETNF